MKERSRVTQGKRKVWDYLSDCGVFWCWRRPFRGLEINPEEPKDVGLAPAFKVKEAHVTEIPEVECSSVRYSELRYWSTDIFGRFRTWTLTVQLEDLVGYNNDIANQCSPTYALNDGLSLSPEQGNIQQGVYYKAEVPLLTRLFFLAECLGMEPSWNTNIQVPKHTRKHGPVSATMKHIILQHESNDSC